MKKRILTFAALCLMVLVLSACGGESNGNGSTQNGNAPVESIYDGNAPTIGEASTPPLTVNPTIETFAATGIFYFATQGNTIYLDANIDDVLGKMGEPISTFDRPSCAFEGVDRFFLFAGVQVMTYPINGEDRVHTIMLVDDSQTTGNGIFIGASLDDLLSAYGHDYKYSYGLYIFTRGNTTLRFNVMNNIVQTISYELLV
ncbi:MAG: hypothetical protein FWC16_04370 [Defluviitaleaceae bacterium]|nr:hypothetical protein [Defluviitaleaceae bacterium]MCL2274142.1 hypothetical protein [Defluviitaleaceae bacterium]